MKILNKNKKFRKLRIISSNYTITYHKKIINPVNGHHLDGQIFETTQHILILKSLNYEQTLRTILHEVIHGIDFEMCINLKNEEDRTNQLTTGITCFMRDNPEFIMEYMKVLRGEE